MIHQITGSLLPLASWMLFASLKSVAIIPLVLLMRQLPPRWLTTQGRYGLWFAAIACLTIPFGVQVQLGGDLPSVTPALTQTSLQAPAEFQAQPVVGVIAAPASAAPGLSFASAAVLVWVIGMVVLAFLVLHNAIRYLRIKSGALAVDNQTEDLFRRCTQLLNIHRRLRILESSQVPSPVLVGYWWPTLLLPENLANRISTEQLRLVMLHELTHFRRHDILANWLISFVQIAHWFNPLVWYGLRTMRNDMEQACDASVLRVLTADEKIEYGNTLIRLSEVVPHRSLSLLAQGAGVVGSRSQLRMRINMIAQFRSRSAASTLLAGALLTFTVAIAVTQAATPTSAPPARAVQAPGTSAAPVVQRAEPSQSSAPGAGTKKQATSSSAPETRKADPAQGLDLVRLQIRYSRAEALVSFIKSVPGTGLISDKGSIAFDPDTNTILVQDTPGNVATLRRLVETLDAPEPQIYIETMVARVDSALAADLMKAVGRGVSWPSTTILDSAQSVIAAVEAAQRDHRVEIARLPNVIATNRRQVSTRSGAPISFPSDPLDAKPKFLGYSLLATPTIQPANRVALDVDITFNALTPILGPAPAAGDDLPPSIDTSQFKTQVVLDSGSTVMLAITSSSGQRLVAFVTPRVLPNPAANPK